MPNARNVKGGQWANGALELFEENSFGNGAKSGILFGPLRRQHSNMFCLPKGGSTPSIFLPPQPGQNEGCPWDIFEKYICKPVAYSSAQLRSIQQRSVCSSKHLTNPVATFPSKKCGPLRATNAGVCNKRTLDKTSAGTSFSWLETIQSEDAC